MKDIIIIAYVIADLPWMVIIIIIIRIEALNIKIYNRDFRKSGEL